VPYPVRHQCKVMGKVLRFMRSVVLMALDTKAAILCDVTPCRYPIIFVEEPAAFISYI